MERKNDAPIFPRFNRRPLGCGYLEIKTNLGQTERRLRRLCTTYSLFGDLTLIPQGRHHISVENANDHVPEEDGSGCHLRSFDRCSAGM
jgi:hypothetical protein